MLTEATVAQSQPSATDMVDALNGTFGRHPYKRASHAKGFCAKGVFVPTPEAQAFTSSSIFEPGRHATSVRFSIAGGNPHVSDKAPAARGLAITVNGAAQDKLTLVMISTPTFFAASRESFVAFLDARRPDPLTGKPDPKKLEDSNRVHLDSEAQRRWLAATAPSASFASAPYFATHTYLFTAPDGTQQPARWIFEPVAGRVGLDAERAKVLPDNFLEEELHQRLLAGPAEWRVLLQVPELTDPLLNPTVAWPDTRRTVEVARLMVEGLDEEGERDGRVYDPTHLPSGIAPSGDPMFAIRSQAYAVSAARRADNAA